MQDDFQITKPKKEDLKDDESSRFDRESVFTQKAEVAKEEVPPETPEVTESAMLGSLPNDQPVAVVKTLSVRGLEYLFMSVALWFGATGLTWVLLAIANGSASFSSIALPVTFLLVSIPVFALFFIRLKRDELATPALRFDPSKRRLSQITQVFAFLACFINVITFVYMLLSKMAGEGGISIVKATLNLFIILVVAGGILAYYWYDEHRSFNK